ncbi:alkaline phosphatase [Photobacterium angustum]|uniref:alkaline phosphatase n=1 Tax=Photobacterium angustum TaxID=661 RepID=UPI000A86CE61|nr:alkaline phosphatase [Photobacterium angustum]
MSILKPTLIASSLLFSLGAHAADAPKYVFFMIGDGMGTAQRQISEYYLQQQNGDEAQRLAINAMPVAGIITTHSANTLVTDSAAAGTALATGVKTDNGVIAMDPKGHKLRSTLDAAKDKGMATGIVTTTRLTHATPATFVAKNISRDNENEIANDYLASNVDFFAGGGYRHFINGEGSKRKDGKNLVDGFKQKGYHTFIGVDSSADFLAFHPTNSQKVFASFASSHLPYEIDRKKDLNTPSLAQMTSKAIETLKYDPDGFFMLVEGGRIDHAAHANDVSTVIQDTIAFDQAVKAAVDFYEHHKDETLIIVAGDHETGGMGLGLGENYFVQLDKLKGVDESIEDKLQGVYNGDRKAS